MQVHVKDLCHAYGKKAVLDAVSFNVNSGEVVGILGVNGAGKSTLQKLLCGLLPVQQGYISPIAKEKLGVVFQDASLDPKLTGFENLRLFAGLYADAVVPDTVSGVDLNVPVKQLSGGMKRKLEIARVFVHNPSLVLMDEPTTGLDLRAFEEFWHNLRSRSATVLINTHKSEEAERCDRLLVIHEGRILLSETPAEFKKRVSGDRIILRVKGEGEKVVIAEDGHTLVPRLVESYPPQMVESVEVRRPTLADAFLHVTGVSLT
ncbi:MAG: ABC transporter ATP-binding protein [Myxococcota bacterium]